MTTPAPDEQPTQEHAALAALASWLAVGAVASTPVLLGLGLAVAAVAVPAALVGRVSALGVPGWAVRAAAAVARTQPVSTSGSSGGVAASRTARTEPLRRAAYLLAAARRITAAVATSDQPRRVALRDALVAERRYWQQHRAAQAKRARAAAQADAAAARSRTGMLRWRTTFDAATTPDCAALDGSVFTLDNPPGGLYPGQRHVHCRCIAVPA